MSARIEIGCPIPDMKKSIVELAHGGGGLLTHRLIEDVFRPGFGASALDFTHDGAVVEVDAARLAFTTDSYVVRPLFFPGGDIGSLAVCGTVNDLAMCGAEPLYLSAGFIIEEGLPIDDLRRIVASMRTIADAAGVRLITGDTKVVERGRGDGLYINTTGIGRVAPDIELAPQNVRAGDVVLLSGDIGRHGIAVMSVREGLEFEGALASDCAALGTSVALLLAAGISVHCLRDPTRGGLATSLAEIASLTGLDIRLEEQAIPIAEPVRGACEILGLDPLYVASEGRFIAFVPAAAADAALARLRISNPDACIVGQVIAGQGRVILQNAIGAKRVLDMLTGEQLPRIC